MAEAPGPAVLTDTHHVPVFRIEVPGDMSTAPVAGTTTSAQDKQGAKTKSFDDASALG
jgi:hypothetical protein